MDLWLTISLHKSFILIQNKLFGSNAIIFRTFRLSGLYKIDYSILDPKTFFLKHILDIWTRTALPWKQCSSNSSNQHASHHSFLLIQSRGVLKTEWIGLAHSLMHCLCNALCRPKKTHLKMLQNSFFEINHIHLGTPAI